MKAALYARVSAKDQQSIPMQLEAMREYCQRRGWIVACEFEEKMSGARDTRPQRRKIIELAKKRKVDVVITWRLNRWGRSLIDIMLTLAELQARDVAFVSITEGIDLSTPAGRMTAGIMASVAQYEREIINENVVAGIAHYRKTHGTWGRPAKTRAKKDEVKKLYQQGKNKSQIARELHISRASVIRLLAMP
jgi:putative DNA-invertase from lambdoid prophage Rac